MMPRVTQENSLRSGFMLSLSQGVAMSVPEVWKAPGLAAQMTM